jgi:hypothetical protein
MTHEFAATIEAADRYGAFVAVPTSVVTALGGGGRIKVLATFDGVEYRGSVVTMGGAHVIGVLEAIRESLGKAVGDEVTVTLTRDDAERIVDVPDDLRDALAGAGLANAFTALSYSHQREYVTWIDDAKRAGTRAKRIADTVERLSG